MYHLFILKANKDKNEATMDEIDHTREILSYPEILVHRDRVIVGKRGLKSHAVDDESHLSEELGDIVHDKAFPLQVEFEISLKDDIFIRRKEDCQVGLLRRQRLPQFPGSRTTHHAFIPVTAKHNLCRRYDSGVTKNVKEVYMGLMDTQHEDLRLTFREANWEVTEADEITLRETETNKVTWKYGLDIVFGKKVNLSVEGVTNIDYSFELVRPGFVCEKGMRIGIAAYQAKPPTKESVSRNPKRPIDISQDKLAMIFGKPERVNIYTGTITFADPTQPHIEYDINSFTGCSGAIVFLLDKGQPEGVKEIDHGKAFAIHAGGHPILANRNIAFKLSEEMLLAAEAQNLSMG
jgi:hypothetical protein